MEENKVLVTEEGYKKLEEELAYLKGPRKMEVAEKIKQAREYGDLSENSEYDEAKNEQALLEAKIAEMEVMIRNATIVEKVSTKEVGIGTTVTLYDYEFEEEIEYHIVGATEVDIANSKIYTFSNIDKKTSASYLLYFIKNFPNILSVNIF